MKGFVYVLTNPSFKYVKIGSTTDITKRVDTLNVGTPEKFCVYAFYEVVNHKKVERLIHNFLDEYRIYDESGGKKTKNEFFCIAPEKVYALLEFAAELCNNKRKLKLWEEDMGPIGSHSITKLSELGIPQGARLKFIENKIKTCTIDTKSNKVSYKNELYSINALAIKLLKEKRGPKFKQSYVNGWQYFEHNGKTLIEIRKKRERSALIKVVKKKVRVKKS